jgi:hypothetical protein
LHGAFAPSVANTDDRSRHVGGEIGIATDGLFALRVISRADGGRRALGGTMRAILRLVVALAALVSMAPVAMAGSSDTTDVACGSVAASWSAPRGALVAIRNDDAVAGVVDAVGEHNTHASSPTVSTAGPPTQSPTRRA